MKIESKMDDLPIELWHLIFDHLELVDLASCAQVSKKSYFILKRYCRIRELAFDRRLTVLWFHPDYSLYQHRVDYSMASVLSGSTFSLAYLRRLKIGRQSSFNLDEINAFAQLEELDIDLRNYKNGQSKTLSLANLTALYVCTSEHLPYLELDTPRLSKVCTFSLARLEFVYPESVRCIHTCFHDGKLSMFRQLEYLLFSDYYDQNHYFVRFPADNFNEFSLTNLKKLKEIHFYFGCFKLYENNSDCIKRIVQVILSRPDLQLFWTNVRMTGEDLLIEYEDTMRTVGSLVAFQLRNYDRLRGNIDLLWSYDFNRSIALLFQAGFNPRSEDFLGRFFAKYSIRKITVNGKTNEPEVLMKLIAKSLNLRSLWFLDSNLDQTFFDRMTDTVRLNRIPLQVLRLQGSSTDSLKLEFLAKLVDLEVLETHQQPPADVFLKLLGLPFLMHFQYSASKHEIERLSTDRFLLDKKPLSLQEILKHLLNKPGTLITDLTGQCNQM